MHTLLFRGAISIIIVATVTHAEISKQPVFCILLSRSTWWEIKIPPRSVLPRTNIPVHAVSLYLHLNIRNKIRAYLFLPVNFPTALSGRAVARRVGRAIIFAPSPRPEAFL